jgi:hypothetical protein
MEDCQRQTEGITSTSVTRWFGWSGRKDWSLSGEVFAISFGNFLGNFSSFLNFLLNLL